MYGTIGEIMVSCDLMHGSVGLIGFGCVSVVVGQDGKKIMI